MSRLRGKGGEKKEVLDREIQGEGECRGGVTNLLCKEAIGLDR